MPVVPAIKPVEPFVLKIEYEPDEPEETIEEREGRPCAVCKTGPTDDAIIAMCYVCHLRVHRSCYGIEDSNLPLFICARCSNDAEPETSLVSVFLFKLGLLLN